MAPSATLDAKSARVWRVLAQLDPYAEWESGYVSSVHAGDQQEGVGTTRRVELKSPMGVRWVLHEVTREDQAAIGWGAARESNLPLLGSADQEITLRPDGDGTEVENSITYTLKGGALGSLVDGLMFRRTVDGAAQGFLDSLRARVEGASA